MYESARALVLYAVEPVHVGAATGAGGVDLPVARDARGGDQPGERGDPILTFSALRGAFRDVCPTALRPVLLGDAPDEDSNEGRRGALTFTDALPLLFPVRSSKGGFAWVTCWRVLAEFAGRGRGTTLDLAPDGQNEGERDKADEVRIAPGSALALRSPSGASFVVIAGSRYTATEVAALHTWLHTRLGGVSPGEAALAARIAVVADEVFAWLVESETERRARVRIDGNTGTVAAQALFSVEAVPRDTFFFGSVLALSPGLWRSADAAVAAGGQSFQTAEHVLDKTASVLTDADVVTIGGEITVGMGRCQARLIQ